MKKYLLVLSAIFIVGCGNSTALVPELDEGVASTFSTGQEKVAVERVISITAERFTFTPDVIRIKKGEKIRFEVDNKDTTHNFFIPELNVSSDEVVVFDKPGEYAFSCANFCGAGHGGMGGTIIVEK